MLYRDQDPDQFQYYLENMVTYSNDTLGVDATIEGGKVFHY